VDTFEKGEKIIHSLINRGVNPKEISILSLHGSVTAEKELLNASDDESGPHFETHTHASEGATTGIAAGGLLGGAFGLLAGLGVLAIPGIGPLIVAGPLLAGLSGLGAGGTLGGILGALIGSGIPESTVHHYESHIREGKILLTLRLGEEDLAYKAKDVLIENGAENVSISIETATRNPIEIERQ
jgi:hypothetical protein